jgi:hypothetical protein
MLGEVQKLAPVNTSLGELSDRTGIGFGSCTTEKELEFLLIHTSTHEHAPQIILQF